MANQSVEQLLISSILRNSDLPTALKRGLNSKMFHIYPKEYEWIEKYFLKRGKTPGKPAFHLAFPHFTFKEVDETDHFTDEVKQAHQLHCLKDVVNGAIDYFERGDGDGAREYMYAGVIKVGQDLGLVKDGDVFRDNEDIIKDFAIRKARYDETGSSGIPTGFPTFDERTGGFAPAEFSLVVANTGVGKSWTLQRFASYAALQGYNCLYYALEQPRANVMARMISLISPQIGGELYTAQNLIRGKDYDSDKFHHFMEQLKHDVRGKLHVADGTLGKITTATVGAGIERYHPDVVYVDHITLMGAKSNDWQGIGEVSDELTFLANRHEIPIISGAQLNRTGAQKGSGLESIGEAYKIVQNASGATKVTSHSARVLEYEQLKYRNGSGGWSFWVKFDPDNGEYKEISYDIAQELIEIDEAEAKQGSLR